MLIPKITRGWKREPDLSHSLRQFFREFFTPSLGAHADFVTRLFRRFAPRQAVLSCYFHSRWRKSHVDRDGTMPQRFPKWSQSFLLLAYPSSTVPAESMADHPEWISVIGAITYRVPLNNT